VREFRASPLFVVSHHVSSSSWWIACSSTPVIFPAKGFHVNPCVYLWFNIYLAILVNWFLSCLLLVPLLFKFMVYGWDLHMMHTFILWYFDDGDWCNSELIFASILLIVKFGQHHVWRIDTMWLLCCLHIRCSLKCWWVISLLVLMFSLPLCVHNIACFRFHVLVPYRDHAARGF
jgi:hypothetical protein